MARNTIQCQKGVTLNRLFSHDLSDTKGKNKRPSPWPLFSYSTTDIRNPTLPFSLKAALIIVLLSDAVQANEREEEARQSSPPSDIIETLDKENTAIEHVIVTGTRLKNRSFSGISPVTTINSDLSLLRGQVNASDMIQGAAIATGSFQLNQQLGGTGPGGNTGDGGSGVNGISLRGLGTNRTLVVLDGNRLAPAGVQSRVSAVDLNVLPAGAIDRIEIVKGGASSVYGADAIAGVINMITKQNYDGGAFLVHGGGVEAGSGESTAISADFGKTFNKGWLSIAGSYDRRERLRIRERAFLSCSEDYLFDPATGERADITEADGRVKCRNHNPDGAFFSASFFSGTFQPDPGGELIGAPSDDVTRSFLPEWARVGNFDLEDTSAERESYSFRNEDSVAYQNADALSPIENLRVFLQGEYAFTDHISAFGNVLYSRRESEFDSWAFLFQPLSADNPNNIVATGLQQASDNEASGAVQFQVIRPFNASQTVDYLNTTMGVRGTVNAWDWQVTLGYGRSDGQYEQDFMYEDRLNAISQSETACDPTLLNPAVSPEGLCDGINIPVLSSRFLAQQWTPEEQAFIEGRERGSTLYEQMTLEAVLSGPIVELPAGAMEGVVGVSIRHDKIDDQPGVNAVETNFHQFSSAGRTKGDETVREAFVELGLPLLNQTFLAEDVSATLSARYTDYEISGSETTVKAGFNWSFTPAVALRASYGTSFRGAALYELFLADQLGFVNVVDPCREYADSDSEFARNNCAELGISDDFIPLTTDTLVSSGGAILPDGTSTIRPETSTSYSVGIVLTPEDIDLSLSLEYYDIEIEDQIDTLGTQRIINACYEDIDANNAFCNLIERNGENPGLNQPPFVITAVNNRFRNIDSQINRGYDVAINYNKAFSSFGLSVRLDYNYELEDTVTRTLGDDIIVENVLGTPNEPKDTGNLDITVDYHDWQFYYGLNYLGSSGLTEAFEGDTFSYGRGYNSEELRAELDTGEFFYHALSVSRDIHHYTLTFGVNNLLDQSPPTVSVDWRSETESRIGTAAQNSWDILGRRYFLTLRGNF